MKTTIRLENGIALAVSIAVILLTAMNSPMLMVGVSILGIATMTFVHYRSGATGFEAKAGAGILAAVIASATTYLVMRHG